MAEPGQAPRGADVDAGLVYPWAAPAADGSLVEVAPGVRWLRQPMPLSLDHINVYLLRDGAGWAVVDTGLATERSRALWDEIVATRLDGLPLTRLICTHHHYDHAGLAAWLMRRHGLPLLMSHGEYYTLRSLMGPPPDPLPPGHRDFYLHAGMAPARIDAMFEALRRDPFMLFETPPAYERLRDGQVLAIGERQWQVVVGEGHAPEHVCLYCAEDRLLIAGDQLLPRISSNVLVTPIEPEANPLQLWLNSLDRLDRLAPDTLVLPSHQGVYRGLRPRVQALREHHERQFALLLAALDETGSATALTLMERQFPRRLHAADEMMAIGETIAHLSCLRHRGAVVRTWDDDGCHRYRRAA